MSFTRINSLFFLELNWKRLPMWIDEYHIFWHMIFERAEKKNTKRPPPHRRFAGCRCQYTNAIFRIQFLFIASTFLNICQNKNCISPMAPSNITLAFLTSVRTPAALLLRRWLLFYVPTEIETHRNEKTGIYTQVQNVWK